MKYFEEVFIVYGVQISVEKIQLMINNINGISIDIIIDNKKFEIVYSFKYLGVIVLDGG